MAKRPMLHIALALLLGDLSFLTGGAGFAALVLFLVADLINIHKIKLSKYKLYFAYVMLVLCALTGFLRTKSVYGSIFSAMEYAQEKEEIAFRGVIRSKEVKNDKIIYYFKKVKAKDNKNLHNVMLYVPDDMAAIGDEIEGLGKVIPMNEAENEGGFDEKSYYLAKSVSVKLSAENITVVKKTGISAAEKLYRLRRAMCAVFEGNLPGEESGLIAMMTVGDKSLTDPEAKELFQKTGLAHIFAISGLHIMAVGMFAAGLLKTMGASRRLVGPASTGVVLLYTMMSGASVSAIRACIMFCVLTVAEILGEAYDTPSALGLAALIILFFEPLAVLQASFIFSFGAVSAICFYSGRLKEIYESVRRIGWEQRHMKDKRKRWRISPGERLCSLVIWTLALQIATVPIVAWYYFEIPVYVLFLNILLLPLAGILLGLGLCGGLLGVVLPAAGAFILTPCHFILYYYEWLASLTLRLPGAQFITGKPDGLRIVIYYIIILLSLQHMEFWLDDVEEEHLSRAGTVSGRLRNLKAPLRAGPKGVFIAGCWVLGLIVLTARFLAPFEIAMLSVGQGDGIFIDSGMGERYFIDGGSTSEAKLAKYTLLPFLKSRGIRSVDVWMISHTDIDHISGFMELLEDGYRVDKLLLAEGIEKGKAYEDIVRLCRGKDVEISYVKPGDALVIQAGLFEKRKLVLKCLAPDHPSEFTGANENSFVLGLKYIQGPGTKAFTAVFTGDIGTQQEEAIVDKGRLKWISEDGIELLKAAHHGSNNSNCSRWLESLSPRLCIISAGKNNRYGHPGKEAVARMDELDLPHLCTIECGEISIRWKDGNMRVNQFR